MSQGNRGIDGNKELVALQRVMVAISDPPPPRRLYHVRGYLMLAEPELLQIYYTRGSITGRQRVMCKLHMKPP